MLIINRTLGNDNSNDRNDDDDDDGWRALNEEDQEKIFQLSSTHYAFARVHVNLIKEEFIHSTAECLLFVENLGRDK